MANEISFDSAPGYYLNSLTVNMQLAAGVQSLQYSVNGGAPSISKYVAYDTLSPPNPFIAVTQDGRGNVVYDGGFPKFYNDKPIPAGIVPFDIALRFRATCTPSGATDAFYYEKLSAQSVAIVAGDKLVYDMFCSTGLVRAGIDALVGGQTSQPLRIRNLVDQNGLNMQPFTDTSAYSNQKWYSRTIDLSSLAGQSVSDWMMGFEDEASGVHTAWFKNVYVLDSVGAIKATLFKDTLEYPNLTPGTSGSSVGSSLYSGFSKKIVDYRDQLQPVGKYFINCMRFIENKAKTAAGNKKILLLGDATTGSNYKVKGTGANDFANTFNKLTSLDGYTLTIKDKADYGTQINPTITELEQYCVVILLSSIHQNPGDPYLISSEAVDAMLTYRENGNGIMVITDHGPVLSTIDAAISSNKGGFFATANALITGFGAWFSSTYERIPVNVGFLRANYGDHPLYDAMEDSESIPAGGSESRVNVASFTSVAPGDVPPIPLSSGRTVIQVAAIMATGEVVTYRATYYVVVFKVSFTDGVVLTDNGQVMDVGVKNQSLVNVQFSGDADGQPVAGIVYKNSVRIGTMTYSLAGGTVQTWDGGGPGPVKVDDGDEFKVVLSTPVAMTSAITIDRFQPPIKGKRSLAEIMRLLRPYKPTLSDVARVKDMIDAIGTLVPWLGLKRVQSIPINLKLLGEYFNNEGVASLVLPNAAMAPYATARPVWPTTGVYSKWAPPNPVTGVPIDFGYLAFSPVYGTESVPPNFKLDYYANLYLPAGSYRVFSHADDIFEFFIDGGLIANKPTRGETDFVLTESRFYSLKVSNTNTPANTPSYWTCAVVDKVTGAIVLRPEPGIWKTQEYTAS